MEWNDFDGSGADATYYMLIEAADTSSGSSDNSFNNSDGDGLADIVNQSMEPIPTILTPMMMV